MSSKRSHDQSEGVHESRLHQVEGANNVAQKPMKKQRRDGPPKIRKQVHASSVNAVKKRIRDVTRLLSRSEDLPADVRLENERALAAYKQELAEADQEKVRQRMIKKYHMKQKAQRALKKLKKQLLEATDTDEVEEIKAQMHIYEVDVNYAHYYPLNERYISLYPQRGKEDEEVKDAKEPAKKPELWAEIERRMEEGTLKELRYGVREGHVPKIAPAPKPKTSSGATATKPRLASETQTLQMSLENKAQPPRRMEDRAPPQPDYTLNRRERRKLGLKTGAIQPAKAKAQIAATKKVEQPMEASNDDGNISDGGFFEE